MINQHKEQIYFTPEELVERFKGRITLTTLANWRSTEQGPVYRKIGGRVLYPTEEVEKWENRRTINRK